MKKTNMRAGFTMIELIFVIVIIGILAAIAMNKMAGTRDDAKAAAIVANTKTVLKDATTYYTAKGEKNYKDANVSDVTSVPLFTDATCGTQAGTSDTFAGSTFYMCDSQPASVVKIDTGSSAPYDLNITEVSQTSTVGTLLNNNKAFQALTNGTTGKQYQVGGSTLVQ